MIQLQVASTPVKHIYNCLHVWSFTVQLRYRSNSVGIWYCQAGNSQIDAYRQWFTLLSMKRNVIVALYLQCCHAAVHVVWGLSHPLLCAYLQWFTASWMYECLIRPVWPNKQFEAILCFDKCESWWLLNIYIYYLLNIYIFSNTHKLSKTTLQLTNNGIDLDICI